MSFRSLARHLTRWLRLSSGYHNRQNREPVSILALMPDNSDRTAILQISERARWKLLVGDTLESAIDLLSNQEFAVILCDRDLPDLDWRDAIGTLAAKAPAASVILSSSVNDDYLWQEVIQCGGYDVLTKPFQEERVVKTISFAFWKTGLESRNHAFANRVQN